LLFSQRSASFLTYHFEPEGNFMLAEFILAAMMTITAPGMSNYSQVPVIHCDEQCQKTPLCENEHSFRCKPPAFNKSLYLMRQAQLRAEGMSAEEAIEAALPLAYSRPETYEEGLARYHVIATQIVDVARENSYGYCLAENQCMKQDTSHTGEGSLQDCHKKCYASRKWDKSTEYLAWSLFSVSTFESGWRSDVQSGTGWAGRGDCHWETDVELEDGTIVQRKVKAWTDGARPIISTCNSFGLTQVWFGRTQKKMHSYSRTYTYDQVLGLDAASTRGSLDLATRYLVMGARLCRGVEHDWAWAMFSMYGSGKGCKVETSKKRSSRFWKWAYKPNQKKLDEKHKLALASESVKKLIAHLEGSTTPVLWMPAVNTGTNKK
jgi:hypothetical protein